MRIRRERRHAGGAGDALRRCRPRDDVIGAALGQRAALCAAAACALPVRRAGCPVDAASPSGHARLVGTAGRPVHAGHPGGDGRRRAATTGDAEDRLRSIRIDARDHRRATAGGGQKRRRVEQPLAGARESVDRTVHMRRARAGPISKRPRVAKASAKTDRNAQFLARCDSKGELHRAASAGRARRIAGARAAAAPQFERERRHAGRDREDFILAARPANASLRRPALQ